MRTPVVILAAALLGILSAGSAAAGPVHVDVYHDEGRLRSGAEAAVHVGNCTLAFVWLEYFDNDGDHLPDAVPPGGPPPRLDYGVGC